MFGTDKPWLKVYEGHVEAETEVFDGSLHEKMAGSMAASGVGKGDRVALMLPNCPQYVISFFAAIRLGAIVTQINPMYVEREIEHILNDSGAETIVVYAAVYERVKAVLPDSNLKTIVVVDFVGEQEGRNTRGVEGCDAHPP